MEKRDKTQTLYPNQKGFTPEKQPKIGGTVLGKDSIEYNVGRESISLTIRNTGDRPIQVGSHYHLFEVNRFLDFDREAAFGMHLNIPSTTAIRFEPGDSKQVEAVAYGGKRRVIGFNSLVEGYAGEEDAPTYYPTRERAIRRMQRLGFKHTKSKQNNKQNKE
ncbi:MAG: urease subunit beta [Alistipes sp.]|nr:urease subunit beta [Alistipes sp.]